MARAFDITPLDATFGAVITGVKLAELDEARWRDLHAAWLDYALLVFPDQHLTREQQIAFARRFGPLEFEMAAISNVRPDGSLRVETDNDDMMKILKGNMGWHADSTLSFFVCVWWGVEGGGGGVGGRSAFNLQKPAPVHSEQECTAPSPQQQACCSSAGQALRSKQAGRLRAEVGRSTHPSRPSSRAATGR